MKMKVIPATKYRGEDRDRERVVVLEAEDRMYVLTMEEAKALVDDLLRLIRIHDGEQR